MGNHQANDEPGRESSRNGYDSIYKSHTYRDYILDKRPTNVKAKRIVVFLSLDLIGIFIILGFIKNLSDAKEVIALIVAIWWVGGRAVIITVKILSFYGKNHDSIKKGVRSLKELFKND